MRRQRWFEIHDQPWFPGFLRDLTTEALEAVWNESHTYRPIAAKLREAVAQSGAEQVVDLCSGGGGPWLGLYDEVADGRPLRVWLTDLYPNAQLSGKRLPDGLSVVAEPVDARSVPLHGFRTIFSSFHHFDPASARAMLGDAFRRHEGIAVFEGARRSWHTLALVAGVPLVALQCAARARPVRRRRILWTWLDSGGSGGALVRRRAVVFAELLDGRPARADPRPDLAGLPLGSRRSPRRPSPDPLPDRRAGAVRGYPPMTAGSKLPLLPDWS